MLAWQDAVRKDEDGEGQRRKKKAEDPKLIQLGKNKAKESMCHFIYDTSAIPKVLGNSRNEMVCCAQLAKES